MLWLALYFPQLPIDRQAQQIDADGPLAVIQQIGSTRRIMSCNSQAAAGGVRPGQTLKNAYALVPNLSIRHYDEDEQFSHLEQLCLTALQYSSHIVTEPPDTIVLEAQASIRLFGGLHLLHERISEDIRQQQLTLFTGIAPTPAAAALFARSGVRKAITTQRALEETLDQLPVASLALDSFTFKGLRQSGIDTLGELRRIPPAALTRRFGSQCTDYLYKLNGQLPDLRTPFQVQDTFSQVVDLQLEAPDIEALAFPLKRLFGALGGFLRARDLGILHLHIVLYHQRLKPATISLQFLEPVSDIRHLSRVASERLSAEALSAPVTRVRLNSKELRTLSRKGRDLFHQQQASGAMSVEQLLDKLMARLGKQAIYSSLTDNDHRPEKAWAPRLLQSPDASSDWPARPVWLLKHPLEANEPITVHTPPERIEHGWWDELDVRRDYFIASNRHGSYLWVYRLRHQPEKWWIHGLFA